MIEKLVEVACFLDFHCDEFFCLVIDNYELRLKLYLLPVAYYVEGRSREQCARRWEQLHPKSFRKGRWTAEEDDVGFSHLLYTWLHVFTTTF